MKAVAERLEAFGITQRDRFPIGISQHKVIQHVIEGQSIDRDAEASHAREVGGTEVTWVMNLIEENFFGWAVGGTPLFDLPLEGAELAVLEFAWLLPLERFKDRLGLEAWGGFELLLDFGPNRFERIGSSLPIVRFFGFAWQSVHGSILPCGLLGHPCSKRCPGERHAAIKVRSKSFHLSVFDHAILLG